MGHRTTEQLAEAIHTTPGMIHYWRAKGKGPRATKIGRRLLFSDEDVAAWLEQYHEPARPPQHEHQ